MTELRHVRRVSLRAPNEALVRRGALLLEDALRTASWPLASPGAVTVVRRLDVGRIDPEEAPAALSLRIEERLRDLSTRAVPARSPAAATAEVVRFSDALEPAVMLVEHVARSSAPPPWFVQRAVPAARTDLGPRHALRAALAAARDISPAGPVALLSALLERGAAEPLLAALDPGDGHVLLAALGLPAPAPSPSAASSKNPSPPRPAAPRADDSPPPPVPPSVVGASSTATSAPTHPPATAPARPLHPLVEDASTRPPMAAPDVLAALAPTFRAALRAHIAAWDPADPRVQWLAAAALLDAAPARRHDPRLAERARELVAACTDMTFQAGPHGHAPSLMFETTTPPLDADGWTAWGGLLFLVPLLERLGMATFLADHPALAEADLPRHLLRDTALRLGAAPDDPLLRALGAPAAPLPVAPFREPTAFARLAGPAPIARPGASVLAVFQAALRRVLRRGPRIGLRTLVERPARLWSTRTHIDLAFDIRRVDLEIRRLGADIDPDFVPWLGRVIRFHYRRGEELHA
jgi:hypothetical protein